MTLRAALVDVGGTLLPETAHVDEVGGRERWTAVADALSVPLDDEIVSLVGFLAEYPPRELRRSVSMIIELALRERDWPADPKSVRRVRHAMCEDFGRIDPLPGAAALLAGIRELGLRCVIVSNTTFHDEQTYRAGFASLGWDRWIDACVTSFDVGAGKPDRRIFEAATRVAEVPSSDCVVIGNREEADIAPAVELGMRAIRVAIEDLPPVRSAADATATALSDVPQILHAWL